jgi:hypothetical protein
LEPQMDVKRRERWLVGFAAGAWRCGGHCGETMLRRALVGQGLPRRFAPRNDSLVRMAVSGRPICVHLRLSVVARLTLGLTFGLVAGSWVGW